MTMKRQGKWCGAAVAMLLAVPSCGDLTPDEAPEPAPEPAPAASDPAPGVLAPRSPDGSRKAPIRASDLRYTYKNRIEVKLREGSGVRPRGGQLEVVSSALRRGPAPDLSGIRTAIGATRRHAFTETS